MIRNNTDLLAELKKLLNYEWRTRHERPYRGIGAVSRALLASIRLVRSLESEQ